MHGAAGEALLEGGKTAALELSRGEGVRHGVHFGTTSGTILGRFWRVGNPASPARAWIR